MRWLLSALFLLALAVAFELPLLAYAMYVLLGILIISRVLVQRAVGQLEATRDYNRTTAEIGDQVAVVIQTRNNSKIPLPWVLWEDMLPEPNEIHPNYRVKVEGERLKIMSMPGESQHTILYQLEFPSRGYYQIGPLMLETGDLFGLHRHYRVVAQPHYVLVHPKVVPLETYDLASRRPIGEIRMSHRLFEDPTRISGVRQYEAGDPLSRIHWRATARTGELQCKTYDASTVSGVTLILDFHRDSYPQRLEPHRSELAITLTVSLANAVYNLGQQFGFITNGRDAVDRIRYDGWLHDYRSRREAKQGVAMAVESDRLRPLVVRTGRGAEQFSQIRDALARVELADGLGLEQLLAETSSLLTRDATVLAIVAEPTEPAILALANIRRRGFAVQAVVVMPDKHEYYVTAGKFLAQGIPVAQVDNEEGIAQICRSFSTGDAISRP